MTPDLVTRTRLDKAATNNGFDLPRPEAGGWLAYASSQAPLSIWLSMTADGTLIAALSQAHVARALDGHGVPSDAPLPEGAALARVVPDVPRLHALLNRAFHLSRTLPNQLLVEFEAEVKGLPRATEAERLVVQRVGQDRFRRGLVEYWQGRCAVTGLAVPELLRASHIKPWADCASDAERLDIHNGLLLAPNLDAAFDAGLLTFDPTGAITCSARLDADARALLGLDRPLSPLSLRREHEAYLAWHRARVYRP